MKAIEPEWIYVVQLEGVSNVKGLLPSIIQIKPANSAGTVEVTLKGKLARAIAEALKQEAER